MILRSLICGGGVLIPLVFVSLAGMKAHSATEIAIEQRGEVTFEASWYPQSAAFNGQKNGYLHVEVKPELVVSDNNIEFVLKPRATGGTAGVGLVDFPEAHVTSRFGEIDVLVGNTILFWGKVESYNPVDIVNSFDYGRGLMRSKKLGAPMVQVSLPVGLGQLDLLAVGFVKNIYPGQSLRERVKISFEEQLIFSGGVAKNDIGQAVRWSAYFGDVDVGFSWFRGIGNAPRLTAQSNGTLQPQYSRIDQLGLDIQYLHGDTAFKGELIRRKGQYDRLGAVKNYRAGVLGLEHSFYDILSSGSDLTFLTEYAFDSRNSLSHIGLQNDLSIGMRWLKNDIYDTEVAALLTQDLDNKSRLITIGFDKRINDRVTFETSLRIPSLFDRDPNVSALAKDTAIIAAFTYRY